jgi:hypothetical protein
MAWELQGTYFENCSCDMVCPCTTWRLALPADNDRCRVVLAFHIDSGTVEGVEVSNLTVAVLADTPPLMADGNWQVGVFIDAAASPQQAAKLEAVFAGQSGGPLAKLAPLIGELLGVQTAPIDHSEDGRCHRVRIGDAVDIQIEDLVPPLYPEGEVSKLPTLFHPADATVTMARATASRVDAFGLQFDNSGKNGHAAPFHWGDTTATPALRRLTPQAAVLLLAAAVAWLATVGRAATMQGMTGTMGLGLAGFVGMWALMMAAMMLPSMARWPPCTTARCSPIARCG